MIFRRAGPGQVFIAYVDDGNRVRNTISMRALTEFLQGGAQAESNLGPGKEGISFNSFVTERYLPMDAKIRLKESSYKREADAMVALGRFFGDMPIHQITFQEWDTYKLKRLRGELPGQRKPSGESTVIKDFKCLRNALTYATNLGLIRRNVLIGVRLGMKEGNRSDVWLKKDEIWKVLSFVPPQLRGLFEFMVWTGARPNEACRFGKDNVLWDRGEIWIFNSKKKKSSTGGERKRYFKIRSLGPKFEALLRSSQPHPSTGLYFCNPSNGKRYGATHLQETFRSATQTAGLNRRVVAYDLRGTFCCHRAMVVKSFRQLQIEMGHLEPRSIQHYLDEASHHDPNESIFAGVDTSWDGNRV
jgi:integrase